MKIEVTAVMPVRNGERHLAVAMQGIDSNQSHLFEILVIDDGSTDGTPRILKSWADRNPKVRILTTKGVGLVRALNFGIEHCNSNYFARFDVDDRYPSDRIVIQVGAIEEGTVGIFSDYTTYSQDFRFDLGSLPSPIFPSATSISLINSQRTAHPSALVNRSAFFEAGGYREKDYLVEDLSLWLRLSRLGILKSVPKNLLDYQISSHSISGKHRNLMLKHKLELINSIGVNSNDYDFAARHLVETISNYQSTTDGEIRAFLHLYDFLKLADKAQDSESIEMARRVMRRRAFANILAYGSIVSDVTKRRLYRYVMNLL